VNSTIVKKQEAVKCLKKWVKVNNPCYLAWKLGYRSTQAIEHWIDRNSIPHWVVNNVMNIIQEKEVN
jgi:hypothetical protein